MVVVTHEMGFAREVSNRVLFLEDGYFITEAAPEDFFYHCENERVQSFFIQGAFKACKAYFLAAIRS